MSSPTVPAPHSALRLPPRNTRIAVGVVGLHVALLAALQSGLLHRTVAMVVPVQLIAALAPPPAVDPPIPPKQPKVPSMAPPAHQTVPAPPPALATAPMPLAVAETAPSPTAPTGVTAPTVAAPLLAPQTAAPAPPPTPAAPKVELPSTQAEYLNNPKPTYPLLSKRAGEQGLVVARVLIGADGLPQKAELKTSSGFDRLDRAALATVLQWRYVPGKRGGVPEAMWFNVPINFVLE